MKHFIQTLLSSLAFYSWAIPIFSQTGTTPAWQNFNSESTANVLLDFSYAGFDHGLSLPKDINELNYKVYNITDPKYGAIANDGKSDRKAFEAVLADIKRDCGNKVADANAIIYFPEGEFILHSLDDNSQNASGQDISTTINVVMGHVILKGAGRDKTFIKMTAPMLPTNPNVLYSSPIMLSFRNNGTKTPKLYSKVTGSANKNDREIEVESTQGLNVGDWILLYMANNQQDVILKELNGLQPTSTMTNLLSGVVVNDYHQIKSINGNKITFEEPIMHEIDPSYGWFIYEYRHYEGVGIEDLTFEGNSTEYFCHHKTWEDDGAYKPINLVRMTNSWIRRVNFISCSECATIQDCANVSCYDIEISGNRGHSAIRMANSSRGFIGNVYDHSDGYLDKDAKANVFNNRRQGLGQYHACGISKHSMGNVIWNCQWGDDACFESHATQPRATLFDNCKGGFMQLRMGGDRNQLPNHLDDLTIWNFDCTVTNPSEFLFQWWYPNDKRWYKTMPPTVIGFHGTNVTFDESQMKMNENQGVIVTPYSLYEAQLQRRLGYLPDWIQGMKDQQTTSPGRTWDFTALSSSDQNLLNADVLWTAMVDGNKNYLTNQFAIGTPSTTTIDLQQLKNYAGKLTAGGKELACAKNLRFAVYSSGIANPVGTDKLMICTDNSARTLRLNANNIAIIIPNCKKGQQIVVHSKSTTSSVPRHLNATNLQVLTGFEAPDDPTLIQESKGIVQAEGDVVLTTVNGNYLYDISIRDTQGNTILTDIHQPLSSTQITHAGATYNLAGQKVNQFYKGIIIRNGRKYLQK